MNGTAVAPAVRTRRLHPAQPVPLADVPLLDSTEFRAHVLGSVAAGGRLAALRPMTGDHAAMPRICSP